MRKRLIHKIQTGYMFSGTPLSFSLNINVPSIDSKKFLNQPLYLPGTAMTNNASSGKFDVFQGMPDPLPSKIKAPSINSGMLYNNLGSTPANTITNVNAGTNTSTGQSGLFSNNSKFSKAFNDFSSSGMGGLAIGGIDGITNAFGLKPKYLMNTHLDNALATTEQLSKNLGNPLVNAAGDMAAGGIGKLMGLNTEKVVGGGMAGVNTVSNVLSNFGPIGMAASVALKAANMTTGKNLEKLDVDGRVLQSSSYTGSANKISETSDKYGGGMVSGIDRLFGLDKDYNNKIKNQKDIQNRIKGVLATSDENLAALSGSADMFRLQNAMKMQDNSHLFNGTLSVKDGGRILKILKARKGVKFEQSLFKYADGGKMNIIPEGALHAHKHNLDVDDITKKGIPVISNDKGGEIIQHAEIERNEIVFTKELSNKLEDLRNRYNDENLSKKEKDLIAIEAGKLLTFEIIENTDDRTGLIAKIE